MAIQHSASASSPAPTRAVLFLGAVATASGGAAIFRIGIGDTFVPEDLEFMAGTCTKRCSSPA